MTTDTRLKQRQTLGLTSEPPKPSLNLTQYHGRNPRKQQVVMGRLRLKEGRSFITHIEMEARMLDHTHWDGRKDVRVHTHRDSLICSPNSTQSWGSSDPSDPTQSQYLSSPTAVTIPSTHYRFLDSFSSYSRHIKSRSFNSFTNFYTVPKTVKVPTVATVFLHRPKHRHTSTVISQLFTFYIVTIRSRFLRFYSVPKHCYRQLLYSAHSSVLQSLGQSPRLSTPSILPTAVTISHRDFLPITTPTFRSTFLPFYTVPPIQASYTVSNTVTTVYLPSHDSHNSSDLTHRLNPPRYITQSPTHLLYNSSSKLSHNFPTQTQQSWPLDPTKTTVSQGTTTNERRENVWSDPQSHTLSLLSYTVLRQSQFLYTARDYSHNPSTQSDTSDTDPSIPLSVLHRVKALQQFFQGSQIFYLPLHVPLTYGPKYLPSQSAAEPSVPTQS